MWRYLKSFLFDNKTTRQTVIKNVFWLAFGTIGSRLVKVGLVIFAARTLGGAGWGVFSYALSLATLFTVFMDFGINALINRESAREPHIQKKYFATSIVIKLIGALFVAAVLFGIAPWFIREAEIIALLPLVYLIIFFDSIRDFVASLSRAWEKMEVEATIQVTTNFLISAGGITALLISPTPQALTISYTIGTGLGMLISLWYFREYILSFWASYSPNLLKYILLASWPFGMIGLMGGLMLNMDTVMIGWFWDVVAVGNYAAAQRVVQIVYILPGLFATSLLAPMIRFASMPDKMKSLLEKAIAILFLVAAPLTAGGLIYANEVIGLIYGEEYAAAGTAFFALAFTFLPIFLNGILSNAIFAYNGERKLLGGVVIGIAGNLIFNLLLIPTWGIAGAAISTALTQLLMIAYLIHRLRGFLSFQALSFPPKIIPAIFAMTLAAFILKWTAAPVLIAILICGILYFGVLYLLREPLLREALAALRIERKS